MDRFDFENTNNENLFQLECTICKNKFDSKTLLQTHIRISPDCQNQPGIGVYDLKESIKTLRSNLKTAKGTITQKDKEIKQWGDKLKNANQEIKQLQDNLSDEKENRALKIFEEKKKEEIKQLEKNVQDEKDALKSLEDEKKEGIKLLEANLQDAKKALKILEDKKNSENEETKLKTGEEVKIIFENSAGSAGYSCSP